MLERDWKLVEIHTKDSSSFFYPAYTKEEGWQRTHREDWENWSLENQFCYELIFNRQILLDDFHQFMLDDLCKYFNVKVSVENRKTQCWVVSKHDSKAVPRANKSEKMIIGGRGRTMSAQNQTMKEIIDRLSKMYSQHPPFVDETGITYPIDIRKELDRGKEAFDMEFIKEMFSEIGLQVTLEERDYPFVIVHDLN
jgi:Protein of unknown function (DUF3738).